MKCRNGGISLNSGSAVSKGGKADRHVPRTVQESGTLYVFTWAGSIAVSGAVSGRGEEARNETARLRERVPDTFFFRRRKVCDIVKQVRLFGKLSNARSDYGYD
jgi:hypothetical protein